MRYRKKRFTILVVVVWLAVVLSVGLSTYFHDSIVEAEIDEQKIIEREIEENVVVRQKEILDEEIETEITDTEVEETDLIIEELISTVTISNQNSREDRNFNMNLAATTINGTILKSGDVFDWFEVIGDANKENGYKLAGVIVNKKHSRGYGGGVCQVSTTLYNAIDQIGIEPDIINHHSVSVGYVDKGRDATVAYPYKNFVFTNTLEYPIRIDMETIDGSVIARIFSMIPETTRP